MTAFTVGGGVVEISELDGEDERTIGLVAAITANRKMRGTKGRRVRLGYQRPLDLVTLPGNGCLIS